MFLYKVRIVRYIHVICFNPADLTAWFKVQTRERWLAYQGNGITDRCVPWKCASVTWGKCWLIFSTKAFLLVQIAVGRDAKQRTYLHMHSNHRGPLRCSSHWETHWDGYCPRENSDFVLTFSGIILDLQHFAVRDFVQQQAVFPDPARQDSRLPIVLLSVLAMFMQGIYSYCSWLSDACLTNTRAYYFRCIAWNWLLVDTVVCTLSVTRAMLTSIWSKWNTDHTVGIQYHNRALSNRGK